jgi:hypothetical protein
MKINSNNILKLSYIILGVGIIFVIFSPFIFIRQIGTISFQETGQIGDTIGGITAPIVNLIGAVLVFFALHAQIEANKIIQQQIDEQKSDSIKSKNFTNLLKIYDELKNDIDEFSYTKNEAFGSSRMMFDGRIPPTFVTYKSNEAFEFANNSIKNHYCRSINEEFDYEKSASHRSFVSFLNIFLSLLSKTSKTLLSLEDKDALINLLKYLYDSKLKPYTIEDSVCKNCEIHHNQFPNDLHDLVTKIQFKFEEIDKQNS